MYAARIQPTESSRKKPKFDCSTVFYVELHCSSTKATRKEKIVFGAAEREPVIIEDIMKKLEHEFSIPSCVQTTQYEGHYLTKETPLKDARIRYGDSFRVEYSSEGDCEEITNVSKWFSAVRNHLKMENQSITSDRHMSPALDYLLATGISEEIIENLAFKYLYPWLDARKYANKLFFVSCGGLKEMMEIYAQIMKHPWSECVIKIQCLEYSILRVLWNLSETFDLRRQMLTHNNCLQLCIQSLLREKMSLKEDMLSGINNTDFSRTVLVETIGAALGFLCNLSELPECHMTIATYPGCLEQLSCISVSPNMRPISVQLVATLFLCLAYTPETHPYLTASRLIERMLEATYRDRPDKDYEDDNEEGGDKSSGMMMLRYFTQVFLSQVILVSPQHIPESFKLKIYRFMREFLAKADYKEIMTGEVNHWYVWSTFLPYIKLLYLPEKKLVRQGSREGQTAMKAEDPIDKFMEDPIDKFMENSTQQGSREGKTATNGDEPVDKLMGALQMLSLQTILLALQNMLSRSNHKEVLWKEQLEDFITCIPSYVPEALIPQAKDLVRIVGSEGYQLQPPRLVNLVKAKLAKTHFGLVSVLNRNVGEIVTEVLCNT